MIFFLIQTRISWRYHASRVIYCLDRIFNTEAYKLLQAIDFAPKRFESTGSDLIGFLHPCSFGNVYFLLLLGGTKQLNVPVYKN